MYKIYQTIRVIWHISVETVSRRDRRCNSRCSGLIFGRRGRRTSATRDEASMDHQIDGKQSSRSSQ